MFLKKNLFMPFFNITNFTSIKDKNIDNKVKFKLRSEDILSFLIIHYEIMTCVEIFIFTKKN